MIRRPPRSTRTYTLFPYTTLFLSRSWYFGELVVVPMPAQENAPSLSSLLSTPGQGRVLLVDAGGAPRSEEHTSELQSLMRISYAVFCLKKKKYSNIQRTRYKISTMIKKR